MSKLHAQDANIWSLQRCLEHARDHNIQLKQAQLNVTGSEVTLAQAKARRLPNANAGLNAFSRLGYFVDPFTNELDQQTSLTFDFGVSSGVNLFTGFQITNGIKQGLVDLETSRADLEQQEYDLALDITLAYLRILQNAEFLESTRIQVGSTKEQRDRTKKLVDAGSLAPADLLQIESQIATEELNVVNAQNQLELSYLALQQILNLDPNDKFGIEKLSLDDPESELLPISAQDVYQYAASNQPSIRSADLGVESAMIGIDIAKGQRYPSVSVSGSAGTGYSSGRELLTFNDQISQNVSGSLSAGLSIPIYNRRQAISSIERAEITLQNAEYVAQLRRQNLKQIIEQAYLDAKSAFSSYSATQRQYRAQETNFQNIEKQFNLGISNSVDYLVAKNSMNMARFDLLRTKYTYLFQTKVLDFYLGKPIGF
ncbi:MAG: TolC family protein [Bacteroidota bacterium]